MLDLRGVRVTQGAFSLEADFALPGNGIVAVMGPSGAGKSTLLNAIAGFLPLSKGEIAWDGTRIDGLAPAKRPVTMLFQDGNLFPHLTARQNVALALTSRARLSEAQEFSVAEALARVGLNGMEHRRPAELSGGQQSRVALARALLMDRPVLLLDEPFAALGPGLKAEMLDLVQRIAGETGALVMMISHEPEDARRIAGQIVLVAQGRAEAPVETEALLSDPPEVLRDYLGTA